MMGIPGLGVAHSAYTRGGRVQTWQIGDVRVTKIVELEVTGGTRFILRFGGIHGDKKLGMEQLGKTIENGRYLKPFAKILLALAARRQKQDGLAQKLLRELSEEFPASPLYAAEYAKAMGRPIPAQMHP